MGKSYMPNNAYCCNHRLVARKQIKNNEKTGRTDTSPENLGICSVPPFKSLASVIFVTWGHGI